jgi:DNA-directed RNA polymerase subunit L
MEMPRKQLNKYWCSVPHCLSDIRNIYIKADRFPFMMLTAANKEIKQRSNGFCIAKSLTQIK